MSATSKMDTVTIRQLRQAIPAHCFERSTAKSLSYLLRDIVLLATLSYSAFTLIPKVQSNSTRTILWQLYGFLQGLVGTGLWIIAHECGHGAFSPSQRLNDWCGFFAHSTLLVPYHSWRITHHRHHNFVAHMDKDTAFVPQRAENVVARKSFGGEQVHKFLESIEDTPAVALTQLVLHQVFGWPMYMFLSSSAGKLSGPGMKRLGFLNRNHFLPSGGLFTASQWKKIFVSDLGIAGVLFMLYTFQQACGWQMLFQIYVVPWFWVHHWLGEIVPPKHHRNQLTIV